MLGGQPCCGFVLKATRTDHGHITDKSHQLERVLTFTTDAVHWSAETEREGVGAALIVAPFPPPPSVVS